MELLDRSTQQSSLGVILAALEPAGLKEYVVRADSGLITIDFLTDKSSPNLDQLVEALKPWHEKVLLIRQARPMFFSGARRSRHVTVRVSGDTGVREALAEQSASRAEMLGWHGLVTRLQGNDLILLSVPNGALLADAIRLVQPGNLSFHQCIDANVTRELLTTLLADSRTSDELGRLLTPGEERRPQPTVAETSVARFENLARLPDSVDRTWMVLFGWPRGTGDSARRPVYLVKRASLMANLKFSRLEPARYTGEDSSLAGDWYVAATLDSSLMTDFALMTTAMSGQRLALVFDGLVCSAPRIGMAITNGAFVIAVPGMKEAQAQAMISALKAGAQGASVQAVEAGTFQFKSAAQAD